MKITLHHCRGSHSARCASATAAPVKYTIDSNHTYPELRSRTISAACRRGAASSTRPPARSSRQGSGQRHARRDSRYLVARFRPRQAQRSRQVGCERDVRRRPVSHRDLHRQADEVRQRRADRSGRHADPARRQQAGDAEDRSLRLQARIRCRKGKTSAAPMPPPRSTARTSASTGARTTASRWT